MSKESIPLIKKFSETPPGLKYENLETVHNLPYIKKLITVKNEDHYFNHSYGLKKIGLKKK
jgi:hypothetical protein